MEAVDCQSFAGGFTMGTAQAGFDLVGKRELPGGFGVASCEANRHLLGDAWETEVSPWTEWTPKDVPYVFGNPPCSGFSLMSASHFRGIDSPVNSCMFAFVEYAARCNPYITVFESVQQAYSQGRPLMQNLRAVMEARTGDTWTLTHVLHNAIAVGGAAVRRRYFMVLHRVPFGVEPMPVTATPSLEEVIGDLRGLNWDEWDDQPYAIPSSDASWWAKPHRREDGFVDGHWTRTSSPGHRRAMELIRDGSVTWEYGDTISKVARKYYETHGTLPENWSHMQDKMLRNRDERGDFKMGFHQLCRWYPNKHARVITGGGPQLVLNPWEDRPLTQRECARIQGFPDDWRIAPLADISATSSFWGKGIPVQCGRWISTWVRESLNGLPGWDSGELIGENEYLVDHTNAVPFSYQQVLLPYAESA